MSMLSAKSSKSSVGISDARLRSGTTGAALELDGAAGAAGAIPVDAVLELASPVSSASVGSEAARFLVGCASRMGPLVVSGAACSNRIFGEGDDIVASPSLAPPLIFFSFCSIKSSTSVT